MKKTRPLITAAAFTGLIASGFAQAAQLTVTVDNLTRGLFATPLLVAAHPGDTSLFSAGQVASNELQTMAEGGDISGLETVLDGVSATIVSNPAGGLLAPGANTTAELNTDAAVTNTHLSVIGMLLPTNDGFVALNSVEIPTEPGTYEFYANAYDAGTEANDELRGSGAPGEAGMPVPPPLDPELGSNGTGVSATIEGFVHIHRGNLGDTDSAGGSSDVDATIHRWLNPVAKITVTVQ